MSLDRVTIPDNVLDRLEDLERRLGDIMANSVTPQNAPNASDDAASVLSGWVITGGVLRDAGSLIVLDPSIPGIQIAAGGRIYSSDFVAGTSGFNINGGTAEFNDVVIRGTIYASVGAIGGWTIGATTISSTNITLTSGLANVASIMVGAGANAGGLNSANAAGDIIFWGGSTFANRASAPFFVTAAGALTATGATITGTITATTGTIGGWTISASAISSTNIALTSGGANVANIAVGAGATAGGINSAVGAGDIVFWAGDTHTNRLTAPFRVSAAGTMVASSANITGVITSTSGTIGGWTIGPTYLVAGAGANTVGLDSGGVNPSIYAGSATPATAPFRVTNAGVLTATGATIQSAGSGARTVLDSTGIKGYDAGPVQRYQLLNDGSGWLGNSSIFAWTTAGVVSLNGSAVMANTIVGGKTNFFNVPILDGLVITNNSPGAGRVAWSAFTLTYLGTSYAVDAGNTPLATHKFIYWNKATSTTVLQTSITPPAQAVDQFIVIFNEGGTGVASLFSNIVYADYISTVNLAAIQANIGACHIDGVLDIGVSGGIYQGTGTFAAPTTGLKIWNDGGVGRIAGYNAGVLQTYFGTDGKLYAGAGDVLLDASGVAIVCGTASKNSITWKSGANNAASIYSAFATDGTLYLVGYSAAGRAGGRILVTSTDTLGTVSIASGHVSVDHCNLATEGGISAHTVGSSVTPLAGEIYSMGDIRVGGGLYVGATNVNPAAGDVIATADGRVGGGLYVGAVNVDPAAGTLIVTGMVGIGTDAPGVQTYAGFTNLTISGSTKAGIVELITQTADADAANMGSYRWTDKNSTAADKSVGTIQVSLSGATANNRGSRMMFYTKIDNGALTERMRIDNNGYVGIGCTPATTFDVLGDLALRAVSPAQITGNTNNWNPGVGSFVRMTSDATYNLTGILAGVDGQIRVIVNVGSFPMTFITGSGLSVAANRMELGSSRTVNQAITLQYDATSSRWRLISFQ